LIAGKPSNEKPLPTFVGRGFAFIEFGWKCLAHHLGCERILCHSRKMQGTPITQFHSRPARLTIVDEWRGISVLLVILHHFVIFRFVDRLNVPYRLTDFIKHPSSDAFRNVGARLFYLWAHGLGPLGVQIFFVISGFVITRLLITEHAKEGRVCIRCFYIRRAFRILPALIFFVVFIAVISSLGIISVPAANFAAASTFLCNTTFVGCGEHFGHLWSLSIEEQFYLVWPWLFTLVTPRHRSAMMSVIFLGCMIFSLVPSFKIGGWLNNGLSFGCIAAGALYALNEPIRRAFAVFSRLPVAIGVALLIVGVPLFQSLVPSFWPISTVFLPLIIVAIVLTRAEPRSDRIRAPRMRSLREIGLMSYSLYLWHFIFTWEPRFYHSEVFRVASIPIGLGLAWLSAKYLEQYFIRVGRELAIRMAPDLREETGLVEIP
jgi:peptidoglycan/LPS O-acetylase OafA/YrhL